MRIRLTGDDELLDRLDALDKAGMRIARRAIKLAVQPIIDDAKDRARRVSPTIAESIEGQLRTKQKGQLIIVRVGPANSQSYTTVKARLNPITGLYKGRWHKPHKTAHLVEQGTKPHTVRLFGRIRIQHPGARPYPFLVPAIEAKEGEAQDTFYAEAWMGIRQELTKRAKKATRIQKKANKILAQMGGDE